MNEWKYINEYDNLPDADYIHCDTRDFYICCMYDNARHLAAILSDNYIFKHNEILDILKSLNTGKCRMLRLKSNGNHWAKYIRFIKVADDKYIAYSCGYGENIQVTHNDLTPKNIA